MKKETKKDVRAYVFSTLMLYGFSLLFSLLSLIFIIDKIPDWLKCVVSFVFMAPVFYLAYIQGKSHGEKLFKARAKTTLSDIHSEEGFDLPYYRCVFHIIGFVVPLALITVLAVALRNSVLRLILFAFEFPVALLFSSVGVIDTAVTSPVMLALFIPYTLLLAGMFVLGYILTLYRLKRRHAEIASEIRMFDN